VLLRASSGRPVKPGRTGRREQWLRALADGCGIEPEAKGSRFEQAPIDLLKLTSDRGIVLPAGLLRSTEHGFP